jgi:hypothetical protein
LKNLNLQNFPIRHAGAGRHPENEANRGEIWIPACAGMTVFFPD